VSRKKIAVIGAGFSGLASSAVLAQRGFDVTVIEAHDKPGGRARSFSKDGFSFDMGPSWYWMPEIMESFFARFGKKSSDFFELVRLDPSYQVVFENQTDHIPADFGKLAEFFESKEEGAGAKLVKFLDEAQQKYETGMGKFVKKPALSVMEFASLDILKAAVKLDLLKSFASHVRKYFRSPELLSILEFPVLFLGAMPKDIPALYSMMNYADMKLGTWYPIGGFSQLVDAMFEVAVAQGVTFELGSPAKAIVIENGKAAGVMHANGFTPADIVISSADYHFTEQKLLPERFRNYSEEYWETRTMAPSCLLYYLGVNKKLPKLGHHNLFFDADFDRHAHSIYKDPEWPEHPLFYVCCPSRTDTSVAPEGSENVFLLIPVAPGLEDTPEIRKRYYAETVKRLEEYCGEDIAGHVVSYTDYAGSNFKADYNAFRGNAYGLANTLRQTAILKPSIRNRKLSNLYYTGQLTVPGPGVPPAIISGQIVADHIIANYKIPAQHEAVV
jgi:phytoene desaturase